MKKLISIALVTFTAVLVAGCGGSSENAATDEDALSSATHPVGFVGTWNTKGTNDTLFNAYTFKSDGTYSAVGGCDQHAAIHCFAITTQSGHWKVQKSGPQLGAPAGASEVVLTDSFNQKDTYFFTMKNDVLELRTAIIGQASSFDHDVSDLKKLRSGATCADANNNSIGVCPESTPCEYDGPTGNIQRCLPPI
jgi:hypothetical protein